MKWLLLISASIANRSHGDREAKKGKGIKRQRLRETVEGRTENEWVERPAKGKDGI